MKDIHEKLISGALENALHHFPVTGVGEKIFSISFWGRTW